MKARWKVIIVLVLLLVAGGEWVTHKASTTSLFLTSAFNGKTDVVEKLLKAGENVDARDPTYGATALIYAAQQGHTDIVTLLLDKGAHIEARSKLDQTALIQSAIQDHVDTVKLLLDRGAKISDKDKIHIQKAVTDPAIIGMLQLPPLPPATTPAQTSAPAQPQMSAPAK